MRSGATTPGRKIAPDMVLPSAPGKTSLAWEPAWSMDLMFLHAAVTPTTEIRLRCAGRQELPQELHTPENDHLNERRKHHGH